jgi:putative addiction module component (TIGR02574 family)
MSRKSEKLAAEALKLPPEGRAALAAKLIESLETEVDEDAEAAWSTEIAQRIADLESGKVRAIPWSEARRRILGLVGDSPKN